MGILFELPHIYVMNGECKCKIDMHDRKEDRVRRYCGYGGSVYIWLFKGHWQQKISTSYIKVFDLNNQNIAVGCCENACNVS